MKILWIHLKFYLYRKLRQIYIEIKRMMMSLNLFISVVRYTFSYSHTYIRKKVCKSVQTRTHIQHNIISVKRYTYFSRSSEFSTNISVTEWTQYSKANKTLEKKTTQNDSDLNWKTTQQANGKTTHSHFV